MFRQIVFALASFLWWSTLSAQQNCPFLVVGIAADGWVACEETVCHIRVCNEGTQNAANARVGVRLPPALSFVSASIPATVSGDLLTFNLGSFVAGDCLDFSLTVAVDCNAAPGAAICLNATVTPDNCPASAPGWDGSDLVVAGTCLQDSIVFKVLNRGGNPMSAGVGYIITEDHLMKTLDLLSPIPPGDSTEITVQNPDGRTYTFQTNQTPGHPFPRPISVSVEGCGGNPGTTGYLLQYPQYNGNVHSDTYCDVVSAAIFGSDKTGFPLGYADEHWIDRATRLSYRIRFQNNGLDTVLSVMLVDTLSEWLDLSTFRAGAASHLYAWSIQNRTLTVSFPAAQLPPASGNAFASRGFFTYYINAINTAPDSVLIENTARIVLDNQAPVQTDTTRHRIGENFIAMFVSVPNDPGQLQLQVAPNPMTDAATFIFPDEAQTGGAVVLELYDPAGRLLRRETAQQSRIQLKRENLPAGCYYFVCQGQQGQRISGRLIVL